MKDPNTELPPTFIWTIIIAVLTLLIIAMVGALIVAMGMALL